MKGNALAEIIHAATQISNEYERNKRIAHNLSAPVDSMRVGTVALVKHSDPKLQAIIEALKCGRLPNYELYEGTARFRQYVLPAFCDLFALMEAHVYRLRNSRVRLEMDFAFTPPPSNDLFVVWLKRDIEAQGSFHTCKREVMAIKRFLCDELGYDALRGEAGRDESAPIKGKPTKENDWRCQFRYMGLGAALNPIYLRGIVVFYLRMGFIPCGHPDAAQCGSAITLLSEKAAQKMKAEKGEAAWFELTKFRQENAPRWREIQRQRESRLSLSELNARKTQALAALKAEQQK